MTHSNSTYNKLTVLHVERIVVSTNHCTPNRTIGTYRPYTHARSPLAFLPSLANPICCHNGPGVIEAWSRTTGRPRTRARELEDRTGRDVCLQHVALHVLFWATVLELDSSLFASHDHRYSEYSS